MASDLPADIQAVIAWLVVQAKSYKSIVDGTPSLQPREVEGFKSDLMLRTCGGIVIGCRSLRSAQTASVPVCLPRTPPNWLIPCKGVRQLVPQSEREGWTYDDVIRAAGLPDDDDPTGQLGVPSEQW